MAPSRRVFLKSGAMAMLSLGFAPSFLARAAAAARTRAQAAHRDLPARRRRRPEHGRAVRRGRVLPAAAVHRDPAPGRATCGAIDLDGFFGLHPRMAPLKPLWDNQLAGDRPCLRLARQHALALRRAGLHGDGHAGREEHARRLAESVPAGVAAGRPQSAARRRADAADAALAAGHGAVARLRQRRTSSACAADMACAQSFETAYAGGRQRCCSGTGSDAFDAMRTLQATGTAPTARGGRRVSALAVRPGAAGDRAARQGRRRPRGRVRRSRQLGPSRQRGRRDGQIATRLDDLSRGIAALAADLGERMADTVILTMSEFGRAVGRERQPRHRPRPRQRDDGRSAGRSAAARSTAAGRA